MRPLLLLSLLLAAACGGDERPRWRDDGEEPVPADGGPAQPDGGGDVPDAGGSDAGARPDGGSPGNDGGRLNHVPAVVPATPADGAGDIAVSVTVSDEDSDPVSVLVEWSDTPGAWARATPAAGTATTGLASSPDGVAHVFVWASAADMPGRAAAVRLRFTPSDSERGAAVSTASFDVDNRAPQTPPAVRQVAVSDPARADATVSFLVVDAQSDMVDVTAEYRVGSGNWLPATLAAGSRLSGLASSAAGVAHSFTWESDADIGGDLDQVRLRLVPRDAHALGTAAESAPFSVRNAPPPSSTGVKISEVFTGSGDWVELVNTSAQAVNVAGWTVRWTYRDQSGEATIPAGSYWLQPGARLVATEETGTSDSSTVYLGGTSGSPTNLNIGWASAHPGSATLVDAGGAAKDFVRWGGSTEPVPGGSGWVESRVVHVPHDSATLQRRGAADTDSSDDFCPALGTRGFANGACLPAPPANTTLRLTEIFAGGRAEEGQTTDWVEIVNAGALAASLRGWVVTSEADGAPHAAPLPDVMLPAGGRIVVHAGAGTNTATDVFTGALDIEYVRAAPGAASLRDPTGAPHDFVRWSGSDAPVPPPVRWSDNVAGAPGATTTLHRKSASTAVAGAEWCVTHASPGSVASACLQPVANSGVVINEIGMGQVGSLIDATLGFIELRNRGSSTVSLADWVLRWPPGFGGTAGEWSFGAKSLAPGERVVLKECPPIIGGTDCAASMPWGMFGSITSGWAELTDHTGSSVDFVRWGGESTEPGPGGQWFETTPLPALTMTGGSPSTLRSMGRRETAGDTNGTADWCLQARTPGAQNDSVCQAP